jgi:hypothetical protein
VLFIAKNFFLQNDQHVFHWRCAVYKSAAEEVAVWGSPLRTSGLLPSTLSARHITLLSGKITEVMDANTTNVSITSIPKILFAAS